MEWRELAAQPVARLAIAFVEQSRELAMSYSKCPRCGLSILVRDTALAPASCPRCLGRTGALVPMYISRGRVAGTVNATPEGSEEATTTLTDPDLCPGELVIQTVHEGDRITLTVRGELDLMGTPALERALAIAERRRPARLVLDLGGVEFIDSRGLCALLHANDRFESAGCQVSLRRARSQARRLLKVSGLDTRFEFEADRPAGANR